MVARTDDEDPKHRKPSRRRPNAADRHLGARIRAAREARGLARGVLARKLGIARATLEAYESGARQMSASTAYAVADGLGVTVGSLYSGLPRPPSNPRPADEDEFVHALRRLRSPRLRAQLGALLRYLARADKP